MTVGSDDTASHAALRRDLGLGGAVFMGLGSILGTGVFVSLAMGAGLAGPAVVLAIVLAGLVATCNALSSAQLAAAYPVSGGTYEYGVRLLSPGVGFAAGWLFLCAKSASAATAALGCAAYALSLAGLTEPVLRSALAVVVVLVLTGLVVGGVRRSSAVNIVIVSMTLLALGAFVVAGLLPALRNGGATLAPFFASPIGRGPFAGLLEATAILFVAYTGYGRIATMGEEVREPRRIIPRAIVITLVVSGLVYASVAIVSVASIGADRLGASVNGGGAVLESVARAYGSPVVGTIVSVGAITAMLGVLLNLLLGLSRVVLAMSRRSDLPGGLSVVSSDTSSPVRAVVVVGVVIAVIAGLGSIQFAWSLSALTVLVYYAITNAAALRLPKEQRLYPRWIVWSGLVSCLLLACWISPRIWLVGVCMLLTGFVIRVLCRRVTASGSIR